jgi:hypothetical protein
METSIAALADFLNTHSRMFATDIQTQSRLGLELEPMLPTRLSDGEYYVVENATATEVMQPYQGGFTPKGSVAHDEQAIRVRPIKLDLEFTEVDLAKWFNSWKVSRMEAGRDPMAWTFPRYIYEKEILPKFNDDLNRASWLGEYSAPAPGVAGDALDSVDGFKKVIASEITAGKIVPFVSGAITSSNIRQKVEDFLASIPDHITAKGGKILMSPTLRRWYVYDYRGEFTQLGTITNPETGKRTVFADDYNIELQSVATMSGSQRMIFLPNGRENMVMVARQGYAVYPELTFDTAPRVLQMYGTIYRGYGFEYPQEVYCNDQA